MIFKTQNKKVPRPLTSLKINGKSISEVNHIKFLGVIVDSDLNWQYHIQHIKSKIAKSIGIIAKMRTLVPMETLRTLYYAFVYPHMNYCIEVWGKTYDKYTDSIIKLQKRIVRIMTFSHFQAHSEPLFKQMKILPLKKIYMLSVSKFMFKYTHNLLPNIFHGLFTRNSFCHHYYTKSSDLFRIPKIRLDMRKRTIAYTGVIIWNELNKKFNSSMMSLNVFKNIIKYYLYDNNPSFL